MGARSALGGRQGAGRREGARRPARWRGVPVDLPEPQGHRTPRCGRIRRVQHGLHRVPRRHRRLLDERADHGWHRESGLPHLGLCRRRDELRAADGGLYVRGRERGVVAGQGARRTEAAAARELGVRGYVALLAMTVVGQRALAQAPACRGSNLHCIELVAPPELPGISGTLELQPVSGPFGVAVTPAGAPKYRLVAHVTGLPASATLGRYETYVAWAYTVTMDSAIKLGVVHNGRVSLGEVAREQFRVLISAEPSAGVRHRSGRLVLRAPPPAPQPLLHPHLRHTPAPRA